MSKFEEDGYNDDPVESLTKAKANRSFIQPIKTMGKSKDDSLFNDRLVAAKSRLSKVEQQVFNLVLNGLSIAEAGRKLGISQQRAQVCWKLLKSKLEGV